MTAIGGYYSGAYPLVVCSSRSASKMSKGGAELMGATGFSGEERHDTNARGRTRRVGRRGMHG